jgi:hypothetical protein
MARVMEQWFSRTQVVLYKFHQRRWGMECGSQFLQKKISCFLD